MRKIFYAGLLAVAASGIAIAQLATAPAQQAVAPPAVTADGDVDPATLRPLGPKVSAKLNIDFGTRDIIPEITVTAPTQGRDADWVNHDMQSFTKITLTRQLGWNGEEVPLKTWENVTAGEVLTYVDNDPTLETGKEYTYTAIAYNGDVNGYEGSEDVTVGLVPTTPDTPKAKSTDGFAPVTVSYTCPAETEGEYYEDPVPFPEGVHYTKIVLTRQNPDGTKVELDVQQNPEPGKTYTVTDTDETQGSRSYSVQTFTDFGNSDTSYPVKVYIGEDYPSKPTDLEAREVDGKVELTWTAPAAGYNGGHFDPAKTYYTVYRIKNDDSSNMELIGNNVKECRFVDELANVTEECEVRYRVFAENGVEIPESDRRYLYAETNTGLVVGPAAKLPFLETFNSGSKWSKAFDKRWTEEFPSYGAFNSHYVMNERWFYYGENEDEVTITAGTGGGTRDDELGPDAYYYVNANNYNTGKETGYLETGKLDFSDVSKPMLSFYYIPIKGSCGSIDIEVTTGEVDSEGAPI